MSLSKPTMEFTCTNCENFFTGSKHFNTISQAGIDKYANENTIVVCDECAPWCLAVLKGRASCVWCGGIANYVDSMKFINLPTPFTAHKLTCNKNCANSYVLANAPIGSLCVCGGRLTAGDGGVCCAENCGR